jgi:hypothetical protein
MSEASHSSKFFIFTQNGEQASLTSPPPPKYKFHYGLYDETFRKGLMITGYDFMCLPSV